MPKGVGSHYDIRLSMIYLIIFKPLGIVFSLKKIKEGVGKSGLGDEFFFVAFLEGFWTIFWCILSIKASGISKML